MQAEQLQNVVVGAEALAERNRALEQGIVQVHTHSQQQTQAIVQAASQSMQQHEDTRVSWQQDVERLKEEYQAEVQHFQRRYVHQIETERHKMNDFCAMINGEVRDRFLAEQSELERMRTIGQSLEGDLHREQERCTQRHAQTQEEQRACAELRQTLQGTTQEAQQHRQQSIMYSQRMQEMLRAEITMASVVRDLQSTQ